ncbi:hypothetical protein, partial [Aquicoccus sp. SU-CL01552]|uniref:hypothetical protein n=1 Tax=Aquicoccus sp. SU-CL01552 TaxID=3127656 RepID=UPI00333F1709
MRCWTAVSEVEVPPPLRRRLVSSLTITGPPDNGNAGLEENYQVTENKGKNMEPVEFSWKGIFHFPERVEASCTARKGTGFRPPVGYRQVVGGNPACRWRFAMINRVSRRRLRGAPMTTARRRQLTCL